MNSHHTNADDAADALANLEEGDVFETNHYENALEVTFIGELDGTENAFIGVRFADESARTGATKHFVRNKHSGHYYLQVGRSGDKGRLTELTVLGSDGTDGSDEDESDDSDDEDMGKYVNEGIKDFLGSDSDDEDDSKEVPDYEDGARVRVSYEDAYRGRSNEFEGEVVSDPYTHRMTPNGTLDISVRTDSGRTVRRVEYDGSLGTLRLRGLHHATKRHDSWMGTVVSVERIDSDEGESDDSDDESEHSDMLAIYERESAGESGSSTDESDASDDGTDDESADESDEKPVVTDGGETARDRTATGTGAKRRTRRDLRYLASREYDDPSRNSRLISHGWLSSQGRPTATGLELAETVSELEDAGELGWALDIFGMDEFIETVRESEDPVTFVREAFAIGNLIDESRHAAGTQAAEYDHDGLFSPHFVSFDPERKRFEVRFEKKTTAHRFASEYARERWTVSLKYDERFNGDHNPRRLLIEV